MFEKVNPSHPDKLADRIAGALVDLAYKKEEDPRIAVEVLIGHGSCHIITESSVYFFTHEVEQIVNRIAGPLKIDLKQVAQDAHLASNQDGAIRCGDNGIFKGTPVTWEQFYLTGFAKDLYEAFSYDGKFILNDHNVTVCQSNAHEKDLKPLIPPDWTAKINPLGYWTGGPDVDTGATNRKLGSDMGDSVTGGGLHGKDLSKADVSVNIYAWLLAQARGKNVELCCAIGDEKVNGIPYAEIVREARNFIKSIGGFEKFAEWGLIR